MKDYRKKYDSRVTEYLNQLDLSRQELIEKFDQPNVSSAIRWALGHMWPPLGVAVQLAEEFDISLSYLLGITPIKAKNDTYKVEWDLPAKMKEAGKTRTALSKAAGTSTNVIKGYEEGAKPLTRINTLISLSEALDMSLDYLLGLTSYRNWYDYELERDPFYLLEPGYPARVSYTVGEKTYAGYCLMHPSGEQIVLASGAIKERTDKAFEGVTVTPLCSRKEGDELWAEEE